MPPPGIPNRWATVYSNNYNFDHEFILWIGFTLSNQNNVQLLFFDINYLTNTEQKYWSYLRIKFLF